MSHNTIKVAAMVYKDLHRRKHRSFGRHRPLTILAVGTACFLSCASEEYDVRAQWLHESLVRDNQVFLDREPQLTAGKFAIMSETPFAYVRGTVPQFHADILLPGGYARQSTKFLNSSTRSTSIISDPHPENLSSYQNEKNEIVLDYGDFDGATYGPYFLDVWRFSFSFWMALEQAKQEIEAINKTILISKEYQVEVVQAGVQAYVEQIMNGSDDFVVRNEGHWGKIANDMIGRAKKRGDEKDRLKDYTFIENGLRKFKLQDIDSPETIRIGSRQQFVYRDTLQAVSKKEKELLRVLFEEYRHTLVNPSLIPKEGVIIADIARRLGSGVSSYPIARYYLLVYGIGTEPNEPVLLEFKEALDAVPLPGLERFPTPGFSSNAQRIVQQQRMTQSSRQNDPWLGWASHGTQGFRIRERSGYQRNFSIERMVRDIISGDIGLRDINEFSELCGRILAASHSRSYNQDGRLAGPIISQLIQRNPQQFIEEAMNFVEQYAPIVLKDSHTLHQLIDKHGFTLGYRGY